MPLLPRSHNLERKVHSQLQQDEGLASPSSPQAQQLTQCDQAAGTDEAAIQSCVQAYAQNFTDPVQSSNAALFAHVDTEV